MSPRWHAVPSAGVRLAAGEHVEFARCSLSACRRRSMRSAIPSRAARCACSAPATARSRRSSSASAVRRSLSRSARSSGATTRPGTCSARPCSRPPIAARRSRSTRTGLPPSTSTPAATSRASSTSASIRSAGSRRGCSARCIARRARSSSGRTRWPSACSRIRRSSSSTTASASITEDLHHRRSLPRARLDGHRRQPPPRLDRHHGRGGRAEHVARLRERMAGHDEFDPSRGIDFLVHSREAHRKRSCPMISHRLALIEAAQESLTVEMAYLGDRRFTAALARAVQRGIAPQARHRGSGRRAREHQPRDVRHADAPHRRAGEPHDRAVAAHGAQQGRRDRSPVERRRQRELHVALARRLRRDQPLRRQRAVRARARGRDRRALRRRPRRRLSG